jgi:large subunit ribosomal protein L3
VAGLLGQKVEMTQIFDDAGQCIPVTVVKAGPCVVVQIKTKSNDGYNAVQVGLCEVKEKKVNRPSQGHFAKGKVKPFRFLREFRSDDVERYEVGQDIKVETFHVGDTVNIRGVSKGKGFQGVIKRHGKHGGPGAHGSHFHRTPGSIGQCTSPGEVFKNMKLPGHQGFRKITIRNLEVVAVNSEDNLIYVENCAPEFEARFARPAVASSAEAENTAQDKKEVGSSAALQEEKPKKDKPEEDKKA